MVHRKLNTTTQPIPKAGLREWIQWALRRRTRFQIRGRSMWPTLAPGDEVLIDPNATPARNTVVVTRHPYRSEAWLVKRLVAFDDGGRAQLQGDNPAESTDSRSFSGVPPSLIVGVVTSRL